MITRAVQHRFGYGAARLLIGIPTDAAPLSRLTDTPVPYERLLTGIPVVLCLGIAGLFLGLAGRTDLRPIPLPTPPVLTADSDSSIELESWITPMATPETPAADTPTPALSPVLRADVLSSPPSPPASAPEPVPTRPSFDPRSLVTAPPRPTEALAESIRNPGRPGADWARPRVAPPASRTLVRALPGAPADDSRIPITPLLDAPSALPAFSARPPSETLTRPSRVASPWTRHADLREGPSPPTSGGGTGPTRPSLPAVALGIPSPRITQTIRERVAEQSLIEGWHEIPLDALPDCSPPGRQDQLKRQILEFAPSGASCTHADGSYRFLETRNLNAFLMWSRTNPDDFTASAAIGDVCDVLMRALRCLETSPTKEL
jgi:hypothetical protein